MYHMCFFLPPLSFSTTSEFLHVLHVYCRNRVIRHRDTHFLSFQVFGRWSFALLFSHTLTLTLTFIGTRSHCERYPYPHLPSIRAHASICTCRYCSHCFCVLVLTRCLEEYPLEERYRSCLVYISDLLQQPCKPIPVEQK